MTETLSLDDLTFELRRSRQRQSVGITIERDGSLVLAAPADCSLEHIKEFAARKRFWIYTRLAEKEQLNARQRKIEYVNGEGFYYLGRNYRLLLVEPDEQERPLRLHRGRFCLRRDLVDRAEQLFIDWYTERGQPWLENWVHIYAGRMDVQPGIVSVQDLGYRWASCSKNGNLNFHWRTMSLPPHIIEYVIVHELAHLHEPHHSQNFWRRIHRVLPDYQERKRWLASNGSQY